MPEIKRGSFSLNLGLFQVQAEVSEDDRQCAWELYTEICTRRALVGRSGDATCSDLSGEVLAESLESVYAFFKEARGIMRRFPVGRLSKDQSRHLGVLINDLMVSVLRPFLEKWQADFRHWWQTEADQSLPPFERQVRYPRYAEFLEDWCNVRLLMRDLLGVLRTAYELVDVECVSAGSEDVGD
ncbi:MAG: hypothetical protein QHI38_10540 [Armatimonadota bacterium]|jgi:hypothetical protein|nr:hypothetical protein [Armatimonadota bacterium]